MADENNVIQDEIVLLEDRSPIREEIPNEEEDPTLLESPNRDEEEEHEHAEPNEEAPPVKKPRFALQHVVKETERNQWELPEELAGHFLCYAKSHFADQDMKLKMEDFPPPDNIEGAVPKMSDTFRATLKKAGANAWPGHRHRHPRGHGAAGGGLGVSRAVP